MGTAGLDLQRLVGLLQRIKVDCTLVEGDECEDHCLLRLSSIKRPGYEALVEYGNQGIEPRVATITVGPPPQPQPQGSDQIEVGQFFSISQEGTNLRGARKDDPQKIVDLVNRVFLGQAG